MSLHTDASLNARFYETMSRVQYHLRSPIKQIFVTDYLTGDERIEVPRMMTPEESERYIADHPMTRLLAAKGIYEPRWDDRFIVVVARDMPL